MARLGLLVFLWLCAAPAWAGYNGNGPFQTVPGGQETNASVVWNSSTVTNATYPLVPAVQCPSPSPPPPAPNCISYTPITIRFQLDNTTPITAGAITVQVSSDSATWITAPTWQLTTDQSTGSAPAANPIVLSANTNQGFKLWLGGFQGARLLLTTPITGAGTVTIYSTMAGADVAFPFNANSVGSLIIAGQGTVGSPSGGILSVQGVLGGTPAPVSLAGSTSGGCTPYHLSGGTAASTNSTLVKNVPGQWCHLLPINTSTTIAYLKIYDSASAPNCASATNLKHDYPIPPALASGQANGWSLSLPVGEQYANGIAYCVTGGPYSDTDNSSAPTGVTIEGSYK